jgi:hypothetical protein
VIGVTRGCIDTLNRDGAVVQTFVASLVVLRRGSG